MAWTNKWQMKAVFACSTNYPIDTTVAIIVDVQATPACWSAEAAASKTMLIRIEDCLGFKPKILRQMPHIEWDR